MRLGGEVQHARKRMFLEQALHQTRVADVALDEGDAAVGDQRLEAADVGGIGQRVEDHHAVVGTRRTPSMHQVLADEAGAPGDQNAMHGRLLAGGAAVGSDG